MKVEQYRSGVACAGNWIIDQIHFLDRWPAESELCIIEKSEAAVGGGAANVAFDLAAFGVNYPVLPVGLIGADGHGQRIIADCRRRGLRADFLFADKKTHTASTYVMTVPGRSRTFFYNGGANDRFGEEHVDVEALDSLHVRIFYLGYMNLLPKLCGLRPGGDNGASILLSRL